MENSFIVRKYIGKEDGGKYIYEESVFDSYDSAYAFVKEISEEDEDCFISEIVSYETNSTSPWDNEKKWTFDRTGKLLHSFDATNTNSKDPNPKSFTGKFKVGDTVLVKPFPWNSLSYKFKEVIGVIATTPISFEEWLSEGKDKYDWDNTYVIDYIRAGYLDHIHIEEKGIEFYKDPLPLNLSFLKHLSEHFQGANIFKKGLYEDIIDGKVFLESVRHFSTDDLANKGTT